MSFVSASVVLFGAQCEARPGCIAQVEPAHLPRCLDGAYLTYFMVRCLHQCVRGQSTGDWIHPNGRVLVGTC